jgi:hypothetical protein
MGSLVHDHGGVGTVDDQLSSRHLLEPLIFTGMVKVAMGVDNIDTAQMVFGQCHQDLVHVSPWIDDRCLSRSFTTEDIAV